jgi:hypothetical protein
MDSKNTGGRLGKRSIEVIMKTVVMTMNVVGLTHQEFRAILDEMGVEASPEPGIYQHLSHPTETGMRIIEVWESQEGFEEFAERRLNPAVARLGIQRDTTIVFEPLHNFFGPRLNELPGLIGQLPGGPDT